MNLMNIFGFGEDAVYVFALIISIKKFDKPLSKYYLTFLGLSTVYYLALLFGGQKVLEWLLSFQNGMGSFAGIIWISITSILALVITLKWFVEWSSNRMGWNESYQKKLFPLIWFIVVCVFCISSYFYYQQFQNDMGHVMENTFNNTNFNLPETSKK